MDHESVRAAVRFEWDGQQFTGPAGLPVAMVLWTLGRKTLGPRRDRGEGRAMFCGIGHCFECRMTIDGERDQRACLVPLREGMVLASQEVLPPLAGVDAALE